ncbi:hypothetical protein ABMA27_010475 [Loxostege sticticalis]|uniref:Uncharacterized protein n=1 Tax=Loxostege sticticalis TaxID=481309 RepID=A0ABR3H5U4_LOXSC
METVLTPPLPFKYDESSMDTSGRNEDWTRWKKGFEIYFKACQLKEKSPEIQINILLHIIGERTVHRHIGEHFKVKKNVTVERHKFFTRGQFENESIDQYIFELRKLALSCEFNDLMEDLIKDRLVCGVNDAGIRERLLREEKLTLENAQEICRIGFTGRGKRLGLQNCPAFGKQCLRCLKMNHFARACGNKSHSVYCVQESEEQVINSINKNVDYWSVKLQINNKLVCFKLDSGADVNVLPLKYLSQIGVSKSQLLKKFKVADVQSCPILSKYSCLELDLLRRVMSISVTAPTDLPPFLSLYEDVFRGIGCLTGKCSITLKDDAEPVIHAPRKLPFAIKDDVRKKLLEMKSQNIIEKVEGPSEWVSSITVVKRQTVI